MGERLKGMLENKNLSQLKYLKFIVDFTLIVKPG
jgi:hypothetical protein